MKTVSLSVPPPFADGPQYDEEGNLVPGSWPTGLPHEGIEGWVNLGLPKGGLWLIDMVVPDDWPIEKLPGGWLANGSHNWDMVSDTIKTDKPTDYAEYNNHLVDEHGDPRTETTRVHVYSGWPEIED